MKISKIASILLASSVAFIIGCGGGGGGNSSSSSSATSTGTFEDAPVKGLVYKTSSGIDSQTDENGTFSYKTGDSIEFRVGNVFLGTVNAESLITPYSFGSKAQNIAYVLQNLDGDANISNGIQLPGKDVLNEVITFTDFDSLVSNLDSIKTALKAKGYNFPDINESQALLNLNEYLSSKTSDPLVKEVLENGLLALKGKTVNFLFVGDFLVREEGSVTFSDNNLTGETASGEKFSSTILEWAKDYWTDKEDDDGDITKNTLLKIDPVKNLIFINSDSGIVILSSSKEALEEYKNELSKKYPKTAIDPKTLKGKYLYTIDDNRYQWIAAKLVDDKAILYNLDDVFGPDDEENYVNLSSKEIEYPGGNKFRYYDDGEWEENEVYKVSLANKDINVYTLASAFDANQVFPQMFTRFNINSIHFTKGNAYCDLIWNECWVDMDALKEIDSAFNNINYLYAVKKGDAKTPKYSKISDYLKEKEYYLVYTEDTFIDYEKDFWDSEKGFCFEELESNTGEVTSDCVGNVDSAVKILAEYDNGILVEFSHDGLHYKTFLYNNEEDAKKVYQILLPKYQ